MKAWPVLGEQIEITAPSLMFWLPSQVRPAIMVYQSVATTLSPPKAPPSMIEPGTKVVPWKPPGPTPCSLTGGG